MNMKTICRLVFILFLFNIQTIWAAVPLGTLYIHQGDSSQAKYSSVSEACQFTKTIYPNLGAYLGAPKGDVYYSCSWQRTENGSNFTDYVGLVYEVAGCLEGSSQSGSSCVCTSGYFEENGRCVSQLSNEAACGAAFYNSGSFDTGPVRLEGNIGQGTYCQDMGNSVKPGLACAMNFEKQMSWKTDDGKWHSEGVLSPTMIGGKFQPCVLGVDNTQGPSDPAKPSELPKKQDPTCPNGYKGDVGGKEACISSYGYNGVDFAPKIKTTENDKTRTETTTKTECASGKCTTTVTEKVTDKATGSSTTNSSSTTEVDRDWCSKPANKDQCAANGKPPYVGQGTGVSSGNSNGNGGGDGDDKGGKCGAKNQVPCKIDEKDTPTGEGKLDQYLDKQAEDHQKRMDTLNGIKNTGDKDTSMGFEGGFGWLTHRPCMPWNFGTFSIMGQSIDITVNICAIEPIVAPVMNFLWVLATIFITVARVGSVMGAKVN